GQMAPLSIVVEEKEIFVLDYRAAKRSSELVHVERLPRDVAGIVDPGVGVHVAVAQIVERRAVKIVGAGLGDHVGDRSAGASELGGIAVAIDLELFHGIDAELVWRSSGAGAAHGLTVEVVVVVAAVHLEIIESAAQTAKAQIAGAHIGCDARGKQEEFQKVASV